MYGGLERLFQLILSPGVRFTLPSKSAPPAITSLLNEPVPLELISELAVTLPEKKWVSSLELPNVVDSDVINTEDVISKNSVLIVDALISPLALMLVALIWPKVTSSEEPNCSELEIILAGNCSELEIILAGNCSELETVLSGRLAIVCAELETVLSGRLAIVCAELETMLAGNCSELETTLSGRLATVCSELETTLSGRLATVCSELETTLSGRLVFTCSELDITLSPRISKKSPDSCTELDTVLLGRLATVCSELETVLVGKFATVCAELETILAGNCSELEIILAGNCSELEIMLEGNCSELEKTLSPCISKKVFANCAELDTVFGGRLATVCAELETILAGNCSELEIILSGNCSELEIISAGNCSELENTLSPFISKKVFVSCAELETVFGGRLAIVCAELETILAGNCSDELNAPSNVPLNLEAEILPLADISELAVIEALTSRPFLTLKFWLDIVSLSTTFYCYIYNKYKELKLMFY